MTSTLPGLILTITAAVIAPVFLLALLAPPQLGLRLDSILQVGGSAAATAALGISLIGASRQQLRVRSAMFLVLLASLIGDLVWYLGKGGPAERSGMADAIFTFGVAYGLGTVTWVLLRELERSVLIAVAIDAAILFAVGATVVITTWQAVSGASPSGATLMALLAAVALLSAMAGWLLAMLAAQIRISTHGPWAVLGGMVAVAIAWMALLALRTEGVVSVVIPTNVLFSVGVLAFARGGITWDVRVPASIRYRRVALWLSDHLPVIAVLLFVSVIFVADPTDLSRTAWHGAATVMLLTLGRQMFLQRRQHGLEAERAELAEVVVQSPESIVITDLGGTIRYVNPAFERVSGYTRAEAIGGNPRMLKSGLQSDAFYRGMWDALTADTPWVADFVNRRKDGSLYQEEAVISPVRNSAGQTTGYVAVKREVTKERAAEALAIRLGRERTLVADTITQLGPDLSPEAVAEGICARIVWLTGMATAGIFVFAPDGCATPLAVATADGLQMPFRRLPRQRSQYLRARTAAGPWIQTWTNRPSHPYNRALIAAGIGEVATLPLRHGDELFGFLVAAQRATAEVSVADELPALVEFASLAGVALGATVSQRTEVDRVRESIAAVIASRAFATVFQPIVQVKDRRIIGYEALTRFRDGTPPDEQFGRAAAAGLGVELEWATLRAAIEAARGLPADAAIHLNASPALIMTPDPLISILADLPRQVVLEVTEHTAIDDYAAFREALAAVGKQVQLAVDDAGAGFASMRHIVELQPAIIKLDRSVIEHVDGDAAREALVAGMVHFARDVGCLLLAEGVETEAELRVLADHGVTLAQGYLFGRPAPLAEPGA